LSKLSSEFQYIPTSHTMSLLSRSRSHTHIIYIIPHAGSAHNLILPHSKPKSIPIAARSTPRPPPSNCQIKRANLGIQRLPNKRHPLNKPILTKLPLSDSSTWFIHRMSKVLRGTRRFNIHYRQQIRIVEKIRQCLICPRKSLSSQRTP
jgi:hypothetical protein